MRCSAKLAVDPTVDATLKAIMNEGLTVSRHWCSRQHWWNWTRTKSSSEGEHGTDTYDGSNSESLAAHLEDVVQALGTVDGVNLASAAITAFEL